MIFVMVMRGSLQFVLTVIRGVLPPYSSIVLYSATKLRMQVGYVRNIFSKLKGALHFPLPHMARSPSDHDQTSPFPTSPRVLSVVENPLMRF